MNTILSGATRAVGPLATIAIAAALILSIAVIAVLGAETNVTGGTILAWLADYLTEVGDALGRE